MTGDPGKAVVTPADPQAVADRLRANAYSDTPAGNRQRDHDIGAAITFFLAAHPPVADRPCDEIEGTPGSCLPDEPR